MPEGFRFNEEDHTYWNGSQRILGVNEVLESAGIQDKVFYTEEARIRGTAVHSAIHYHDQGDLDMDSVHPEILPYLEAWQAFCKEVDVSFDLTEVPSFNEILGVAGTPDRVGTLNGKSMVLDIKTGALANWVSLQLAGYKLIIGSHLMDRFALQLKADGSWNLKQYDDRTDERVFASAVAIAKWKFNNS